jgi:hypothetical protein
MKFSFAVFILSIAVMPTASQAATITKSLGTTTASINGSVFFNSSAAESADTQASQTVVLEQFDSGLGTLDSVQIILQADVGNLFSIQNNSAEPQDFTAVTEATFSADWTGAASPLQDISVLDETVSVDPYDPSQTATVQFGGGLFGGKRFALTGSDMSPFIGTGTIDIEMTLDLFAKVSTASGVQFDISGGEAFQAQGSGSVTYSYTEATTPVIPLPAGLPLLATALGLGALLRHRRR